MTDGGEARPKLTTLSLFTTKFIECSSRYRLRRELLRAGALRVARRRISPAFSESDMTVLNPRSKMISVRLSEEEYAALRELCSVTGARSVSDLTRDAMRALLNSRNQEEPLRFPAGEFRDQLMSLDHKIEQLASEIANLLAPRTAED